jgi:hypothetical protein
MRLRIFGIPKWVLFGFGLLPALIWLSFHSSVIQFKREEMIWVSSLGLLLSVMFTFSLRRGLFAARFWVYLAIALVILSELLNSVTNRDFPAMAGSLFFLAGAVYAGLWLERRISSAMVNPECEWFDGSPKVMSAVNASIRFDAGVVSAKVRKLDFEGVFVFLDSPISVKPKQRVWVRLEIEGALVEGDAWISSEFLGEKQGLGLQFLKKDLYHSNEYTGIVQELRGKGL